MLHTFNFFRRAGACSRRNFIRTVEDACPYNPLRRLTAPPLPRGEALKPYTTHSQKRCGRDAASLLTNFKALRGLGHSRKCHNDFFASFFFA